MSVVQQIKPSHIARLGVLCLLVILAAACNNKQPDTTTLNIIVDSHVVCTYDAQSVVIDYTTESPSTQAATSDKPLLSATTQAAWIDSIECSDGQIKINVAANEGALRTAVISLSGTNIAQCSIQLSQIATPPAEATHTLIYYFFGTSLSRYFDYNTEDTSTAIGEGILGENNRVVLLRQKSQYEAYYAELCYDPIHHSAIERHIADCAVPSEVTPEHIANTLNELGNIAPAQRYGMVLAGHGQGWVTREALNKSSNDDIMELGIGYDIWTPHPLAEVTRAFGERNVQVDIQTIAEGIATSNLAFDYLLFDACFMSNIEALYDLRHAANYIIASPCEIMGRGFPYHRTLPFLFANGGTHSDLPGAAESYYKYYLDEYYGASRCGSVAVIDCSEIEAVADATCNLMATAYTEYDTSQLQTYEGHTEHIFYDFGQLCRTIATDAAAIAEFDACYERMVVAKYSLPTFYSAYGYDTYPIDLEVYSGVTTSQPSNVYPNEWRTTSWYGRIM